MPKPIKHHMKDTGERANECQSSLKKKFTKFWRKAKKKGWDDAEIATAVATLSNVVPNGLKDG
jgi:hypothetical protein